MGLDSAVDLTSSLRDRSMMEMLVSRTRQPAVCSRPCLASTVFSAPAPRYQVRASRTLVPCHLVGAPCHLVSPLATLIEGSKFAGRSSLPQLLDWVAAVSDLQPDVGAREQGA